MFSDLNTFVSLHSLQIKLCGDWKTNMKNLKYMKMFIVFQQVIYYIVFRGN